MGRAVLLGSVSREGVELSRDSHHRAAHSPDHSAGTASLHVATILNLHLATELRCQEQLFFMRHSTLKDWPGARSLCIASSQQVKIDEAQRKREKNPD